MDFVTVTLKASIKLFFCKVSIGRDIFLQDIEDRHIEYANIVIVLTLQIFKTTTWYKTEF